MCVRTRSVLVVSALDDELDELFELDDVVCVAAQVRLLQQSFEVLVAHSDVYLFEHGLQYFEGHHTIICPVKAAEELTENELFVVALAALLHELEAEGGHELLKILLVYRQVGRFFDLPRVADQGYELPVIENCHGHIGIKVKELLAGDFGAVALFHADHLAPLGEDLKAEALFGLSHCETLSAIWVKSRQCLLHNLKSASSQWKLETIDPSGIVNEVVPIIAPVMALHYGLNFFDR